MPELNNTATVTLDTIKEELPKIRQNSGLENFSQHLDSRLSYIESQLKQSSLTPDERKIYEDYIQSVLQLQYNWTEATKRNLSALQSQITGLNKVYIETILQNELQSQVKLLESGEKLSIDNLEQRIDVLLNIINLSWIEKIPVLKEKGRDILQYEPMIQGFAGASLIRGLEQNGYALYFDGPGKVRVVAKDKNIKDEQAIEVKLNAYLKKSAVFPQALQTGMLYVQPSFTQYQKAVLDKNGNIIDPTVVNIKSYVDTLRKKPQNELTPQEQVFLRTQQHFDQNLKFTEILKQNTEYQKLVTLLGGTKGDADIGDLLANSGTQKIQNPPAASSTGAGMVGEGIGKLGGLVGRLAGAGAGGGMRVLGEVFSEATKHGGAWGALAVIGGLIFSIWKGGFWKTLGGIFAVGLADSASRGEISLPKSDKKPDSTEVPPQGVAAATVAGAAVSAEASKPAEGTQASRRLDYTSLIATAMGDRPNPYEADINVEKAHIGVLEGASYDTLVAFYIEGKKDAGDKIKESLGYDTLSADEKKKINDLLDPANGSGQEVIIKLLNYLQSQDTVKNMNPVDRQGKTLKQMIDTVIDGNNNAVDNHIVTPGVEDSGDQQLEQIQTLAEGHSSFVVLSRLLTRGYLPQLGDKDLFKDTGFFSILKGPWAIAKSGLQGFGTLNNDASKNPLVGSYNEKGVLGMPGREQIAAIIFQGVEQEKVIITEAKTKLGNLPGSDSVKEELLKRLEKLNQIERLKADPNHSQVAMKNLLSEYDNISKTKITDMVGRWGITFSKGDVWYRPKISKTVVGSPEWSSSQHEKISSALTHLDTIGEQIDQRKQQVLSKFADWEANPKDPNKKKLALDTLAEYNKWAIEQNKSGLNIINELTPEEAKKLSSLPVKSRWFKEFSEANLTGQHFKPVQDKIDKFSTGKLGTANKYFMGAGMLSLAYHGFKNNEGGTGTDYWKDGDYWQAARYYADFGIGIIPWVGTAYDTAILNSNWLEKWMLGKKMTEEERTMRTAFAAMGIIPGVGAVGKIAGKKIGSELLVGAGSMVFKGGNAVRGIATYGVLGLSIGTAYMDLSGNRNPGEKGILSK